MKRGWHLALAESCTGGLVSHRITNVPGSSSYYLGGITAYANETKMRLLGVRTETLEEHGAVSRETVLEMARGARQTLQADIAMSISGIAGPGGETPGKPVGLTWIGLSAPDWENAWSYIWSGNRLQVKEQSAEEVLRLLRDYLSGSLAPG
jgi:PncC family amidohydrolase